jgi:DNA gyrase inhibitor GyrI
VPPQAAAERTTEMADEITERHLKRLRVRGAPATIPGAAGFVGSYDVEEVWRQTGRALVLPLPRVLTTEALRDAFARLGTMATQQKATVLEEPLFALKGDPNEDPPHKWEYEAVLPVRGNAKADGEVTLARVQGGMHIATFTGRGLADLGNVYVYLFGRFLPSRKQQLMRPYLLHRIIQGLEGDDANALAISVFVPAVLSIKPVPVPGESAEA